MSMKPVSNGGYAVTGRIKYIPGNYLDAFLLKIDTIGEVQWMKVYSASNETSSYDVAELSDNSLLVVGYNQGTNGNGFVLKTDQNGNLLFSRTELFPAPAQYASVHSFTPATVMMSGRRGGQIAFTALADTACTSICNITNFVIPEFQPAYSDTLLSFVPAGLPFNQNSLSVLYYSLPLMRNLLCSSTSVMESAAENRITAYPNPVTDKLFVSSATDEVSEIIVINMNSEKILHHTFTGVLTLDVGELSQGMYFYEIRNRKGDLYRNKFVKE
jgi:hypothetical protein